MFRPDLAMLCASLRHGGDEYVAWPRTVEELRAGRATAIPLVHPWANRLAGDSYRAAGVDVSLTGLTLPRDPNGLLIHGNLFAAPFEVEHTNATRVAARPAYGAHPAQPARFPLP